MLAILKDIIKDEIFKLANYYYKVMLIILLESILFLKNIAMVYGF